MNVIVVTGAAKGLGAAISKRFAQQGDIVVLVDIDAIALDDTVSVLKQAGCSVYKRVCDVRNTNEVDALFEWIRTKWDRLDGLVNNAGISRWKSPYELSVDEWNDVIQTNLSSVFFCTRAAAKQMRTQGGFVINIASTRALMSEPDTEAYAASKGGILALTHAFAASLAPDRIRVNCISPGWIETGDYDAIKPDDHRQHFSGRVGKPEDVARACLFLSHAENDFINGINLILDGGMTHKMIYLE